MATDDGQSSPGSSASRMTHGMAALALGSPRPRWGRRGMRGTTAAAPAAVGAAACAASLERPPHPLLRPAIPCPPADAG